MHTRPALPTDIPAIATISAHAFQSDELYNFTHPSFRSYQRCFRDYFLRRNRLRYWTPGFVFFVAETDADDYPQNTAGGEPRGGGGGGEVIAFALYNLHPPSGSHLLSASPPITQPYTALLERTLCTLQDTYISLFALDRSLNPSRAQLWRREQDLAFQRFWAEHGPVGDEDGRGYYTLQNLCVEPMWQRRGAGQLLIEVGQREAGGEGVKVVLTSSEVGAGLYARMGFERRGELRVVGWKKGKGGEEEEGGQGQRDREEDEVVVGASEDGKGEEEDWWIVPIFVWEPPGKEMGMEEEGRARR